MPIDSLTKDLHSDYSPNDDLWFIYGRFLLRVLYDQMALRVKNVLPIGLLCYQCVTTWLFLCYHRPSKSSVSWWILTCYAITPYWVFDPRMCYRRPPCESQNEKEEFTNELLFFYVILWMGLIYCLNPRSLYYWALYCSISSEAQIKGPIPLGSLSRIGSLI